MEPAPSPFTGRHSKVPLITSDSQECSLADLHLVDVLTRVFGDGVLGVVGSADVYRASRSAIHRADELEEIGTGTTSDGFDRRVEVNPSNRVVPEAPHAIRSFRNHEVGFNIGSVWIVSDHRLAWALYTGCL